MESVAADHDRAFLYHRESVPPVETDSALVVRIHIEKQSHTAAVTVKVRRVVQKPRAQSLRTVFRKHREMRHITIACADALDDLFGIEQGFHLSQEHNRMRKMNEYFVDIFPFNYSIVQRKNATGGLFAVTFRDKRPPITVVPVFFTID